MFFKLRSAFNSVKGFFEALLYERDATDPENKKKDVPKKFTFGPCLAFGFRVVGAAIFIASPGILAMPFLMGTPWIDTILLLALAQWVGYQFMDFYKGWVAAISWAQTVWHILRHGRKGMAEVMA